MRDIVSAFSGWARMNKARSETVRVVDTALVVVGTLLVATSWALLQK